MSVKNKFKSIYGHEGGAKFIFGNSPAAVYLSDVLIDKRKRKQVSLFLKNFNTDMNRWFEMYALAYDRIKLNKSYQEKSLLFLYNYYKEKTDGLIANCGLLITGLVRNLIKAKYRLYKRVIRKELESQLAEKQNEI